MNGSGRERMRMTGSDEPAARALNQLAREQMIKRLLADINADLTVCRLEGWDAGEYVERLKKEIDGVYELFENCRG